MEIFEGLRGSVRRKWEATKTKVLEEKLYSAILKAGPFPFALQKLNFPTT
jgi:hypothetical protein